MSAGSLPAREKHYLIDKPVEYFVTPDSLFPMRGTVGYIAEWAGDRALSVLIYTGQRLRPTRIIPISRVRLIAE